MTTPMMKCGHAANGINSNTRKPVCVICISINPGAEEIDESTPNFADRKSKCTYCSMTKPSSPELTFFEHRPKSPMDSYYCGCKGWD